MLGLPCLQPIRENASLLHVDMCRFGLKLPGSEKLIRKSTAILTTYPKLAHALSGLRCRKNHVHQVVRGKVRVGDETMSVSTFTASYTKQFARHLARSLIPSGEIGRVRYDPSTMLSSQEFHD